MILTDIAIFLGRFHPLMVHLPIGFLILAFLMWAYGQWKGGTELTPAISFALLLGTFSALLSCILGYLLSLGGGYDEGLIDNHMWAGIATTLFSGLLYFFHTKDLDRPSRKNVVLVLFLCMMVGLGFTGHMGGSLTHGEDYLMAHAPFGNSPQETKSPTSMQEVVLFDHVIMPILEEKCSSCHREGKLKGGLSFASSETLMKGGANGRVLKPGNAAKSEMVKRVNLSREDKYAMPPKGKEPLTEDEKFLIAAWIDKGASTDIKLLQMEDAQKLIEKAATYLSLDPTGNDAVQGEPKGTVPPEVLEQLERYGFTVRELVAGTNSYDVIFPASKLKEGAMLMDVVKALGMISENIVWLNLSGIGLEDSHMKELPPMPHLEKLRLEKNQITNEGIAHLLDFKSLKVINLYENPISEEAKVYFAQLPKLEKVYGWKTGLKTMDSLSYQVIL